MAVKKIVLAKKISGVIYDIYAKTSADIVEYSKATSSGTEATTVAAELANLASDIATIVADTTGTIDTRLKAESDALYNKIMGITEEDGTTVTEAYDTLKEVAAYIATHEAGFVASATTDINALKAALGVPSSGDGDDAVSATGLFARMESAESRLTAVEGRATTLEGVVGDASNGLVKAVADLQAAATKVVKSDNNGYVKVDGSDVLVYDDSAIAATKIVEDDTHKFITAAERTAWNANAEIKVVNTLDGVTLDETDLAFVVIA